LAPLNSTKLQSFFSGQDTVLNKLMDFTS